MNFNSYIISETEIAKTLPLNCPPPYSSKVLGHFFRKSCFKKGAFTLAETLITLTIVGVIAALTVPTLISNYQKHTFVVGLKKAYSQLQNAVKMLPINEGCPAGDYECAGFTARTPEENNIALLAKQFKTISINDNNAPACKGIYEEYSYDYYGNFTTEDGMCYASSSGYWSEYYLSLFVDINGEKGPNKWGRDRFKFYVAGEDRNGIPKGTVMPMGSNVEATYYYSTSGYTFGYGHPYWKDNNNCTTQNANNSWSMQFCTGRVLEEDAMNY